MDREHGLADARDGLGLQDLINQSPSRFSSLSLNPAVAQGSAVWPHVPIPQWGSRLGQRLAHDSPIDVSKGDRRPLEIHAQDGRDVAASCREVESRLQFVHEGDSVSAEVLAHSDPAVMVHDHKLEPAPRQKRVRRHAGRRPERFESCKQETILVDAGESDLLVGAPYRAAGLVQFRAKLRQCDTIAALHKTPLPDSGAQLRHPLVETPLSATTDLPAPQQVHRSGCAMHPRGNDHHVGQPDQVSRVMGKELPDPFNCRCHCRFPKRSERSSVPHRLRYQNRNAGSSTVFCASAPTH